jgi:hypothetical protein
MLLGSRNCTPTSVGPELSLTGEVSLWLLRTQEAVPKKSPYWAALPPQYASTGIATALENASAERQSAWLTRNRTSLAKCAKPAGKP